jgi:hypothetical protein
MNIEEIKEEIQTTFNEDSIEELVEDGSVENADENELSEQQ